jgi:drug/metabolite transporter (DMT)-like permease
LVGFEPGESEASALGDLAALGSAVTLAVYVLAGRWLRGANPLATYVTGIYGWAAIAALPAATATFDADALGEAVVWIVLLGIGPLAIGHTLINAALRRLPATVPNVIATQEVPAGVLIGALLVQEVPGLTTLIGGLIALAGVIAVVVGTPVPAKSGVASAAET